MSERPYVSFAEVKARVTIPECLEIFGVAGDFKRNGDRLTGKCPLPQHKHGPQPNHEQFKVDKKDGIWVFK